MIGGRRYRLLADNEDNRLFKVKYELLMKNLSSLIFYNPDELDLHAALQGVASKIIRLHVTQKKRYRADFLRTILDSMNYIAANRTPTEQNADRYQIHIAALHTAAIVSRKNPVLRVLSLALLALVGAAILAATGFLAAAAFGLCPPIAIGFGIVIGYSVTTAATVSSVGGILGISALMGSGMMMFKTLAKPSLSSRLREVVDLARPASVSEQLEEEFEDRSCFGCC